ncbi:UNVERIFIED_CONTAM: Cation/H(+) antiporter 15 [Sesamum radiatum]|uniref:Cation/H(+) antiporter 15 n=1 Tax=Sesamum radiatum TaxID=300843 RepID=A0AAW2MEZ0_SESRA
MSQQVVPTANKTEQTIVCYAPTMITTNGIWQGDNPLDYSLPLFILQLTLVVVTTRILVFALKPLRQPRVISEILGGIILGPSVLGRSSKFAETVFPLRSVMVLETMANVGLLYFLFLVGVEMDIGVIKRTGKQALAIAISGMILPFVIGVGFAFLLHQSTEFVKLSTFILFLGVALSVTAFPVLARILAELKLLNTEIGKIAMSSALINDMCAWVLLAFAIALAENEAMSLASIWVILSSGVFVVFCVYVVRPLISWMIRRTPEGESISEFSICLILTGVMISGFITDAIGTHSVFGAFVFGLVIPNGPLGVTLIERLEDFVSGLLLPLFFAISGLKTDIGAIDGVTTWVLLFVVIVLACAGKIAGTLLVSFYYKMPFYEGLTLGLLMNTKGLVEMIVLNVGKDQKEIRVLQEENNPANQKPRISHHGVCALQEMYRRSSTLEASYPTKKSPICAYVLHLVELTGRASAMLIVHNTRKTGRPALNRTQAQSDHIINAFENFEQHAGFVSVNPLTAISPYSTMHEDICNVALDKRVAFIIVPFHKQQTVDGGMEATNPAFRTINQNVLANAPCSVGILVDRGLNGSTRLAGNQVAHHVALLFFGGPDDREALAYAWRMSEHQGTNLTLMRFLPGENAFETTGSARRNPSSRREILSVETNDEKEQQLDEEYLNEFKSRTMNDSSIIYTERVVNHGEETVAAIRSIDPIHDLFIVGRGQGMISPLTAGLTDWSECPELGAIGDLLASSDFAASYSVLVVQQYMGIEALVDPTPGTPDSPTHQQPDQLDLGNRRPPPAGHAHVFQPQP